MNDTVPEAPETIEAQLQWLREGKRKAVLLTPGVVLPRLEPPLTLSFLEEGLLVYHVQRANEVSQFLSARRPLAELLNYGVPGKPEEENPPVVVVRDGVNGHEKQTVVAGSERLDAALQAAHAVKSPGDTVHVEDGQRVLNERLRALDARELSVRPFDPELDSIPLKHAAKEDGHTPLNPTHVIERGEEIVGYFGLNSLPLYRLWFHSAKLKATDSLRLLFMIENHYRMGGVRRLATIIDTTSPFYPCAARGGYLELPNSRLFLKGL